jgi:hypothetical protein
MALSLLSCGHDARRRLWRAPSMRNGAGLRDRVGAQVGPCIRTGRRDTTEETLGDRARTRRRARREGVVKWPLGVWREAGKGGLPPADVVVAVLSGVYQVQRVNRSAQSTEPSSFHLRRAALSRKAGRSHPSSQREYSALARDFPLEPWEVVAGSGFVPTARGFSARASAAQGEQGNVEAAESALCARAGLRPRAGGAAAQPKCRSHGEPKC